MREVTDAAQSLTELRRRAERKARRDLEALRGQPPTKTEELVHELRVHQIELEMQNEELRRAQVELDRLRGKYFDLFDLAPVGYFAFDARGIILEANLTAAGLLGTTKPNLLGRGFSQWVTAESQDTYYLHRREAIESGIAQICELKLKESDGTEFFAQLVSRGERDDEGKFRQLRTTLMDITRLKKAEQLVAHHAKLKDMASRMLNAEDRERRRIAVEIHDNICQKLVMNKLALEAALRRMPDPVDAESLRTICRSIGEVIEEGASLTFSLSSPILYELGLVEAIRHFLDTETHKKHGIAVEFESDGRLDGLTEKTQNLLFRTSRELLTNVVKHAQAHRVKLSIRQSDDRVTVSVRDDGIGFDESKAGCNDPEKPTFGLFSIREQLAHFAGHLEIESEPGRGTTARIVLPLDP